ncbi:CNNM domain-containing protein [Tautonia marina]|uniref:CNNM domain-containing protein n=1 Tax=Tautonia marina TaxID=2653855 RepID=UPI001375BD2A|nr:CNNM domain-containing protein [Tautonia marina]
MIVLIVSVVAALSISALCSLLEASLLSLTPSQVGEVAQRHPASGELWRRFKADVQRPIAVILILNTAAHTIGATIAGAEFEEQFGEGGIIYFSILFTFLMLQFTEILPKTMGVRYNRQLAPWIAQPLAILIKVLSPILWLIHFINRPFQPRREKGKPDATIEEIAALAGLARLSNLIGSHQERIIKETTRLTTKRVEHLMIPVEDVAFLSTEQTVDEAIGVAQATPHTRFPVCEESDVDRVIGYVNFKDLITHSRSGYEVGSLREIIRPMHVTSPEEQASDLLKVYVEQHVHIAIVRDDGGKTLGLITLEDIIEELVGELEDEYPVVSMPRMIQARGDGAWVVGGGVTVGELGDRLGKTLSDSEVTVSNWLAQRLSHPPRPGETYREGGLHFAVRRIRRGQVFEVLVQSDTTEDRTTP